MKPLINLYFQLNAENPTNVGLNNPNVYPGVSSADYAASLGLLLSSNSSSSASNSTSSSQSSSLSNDTAYRNSSIALAGLASQFMDNLLDAAHARMKKGDQAARQARLKAQMMANLTTSANARFGGNGTKNRASGMGYVVKDDEDIFG